MFVEKIYNIFQRKTNTTSFIPQIDGLRFLAILMVVLFHLNVFITVKAPFEFISLPKESWWMFELLQSDKKGVFLFFVISGFILAMPFAKAIFKMASPVKLKDYYLRRFTRLEPPYFLVMVACFLGILFLPGNEFASSFPNTFFSLLPRLLASLGYVHNLVFSEYLSLNPVAWSLEIEIQFYLIVPLLVKIFKLPTLWRRIAFIVLIFGFIFLQSLFKPSIHTLFNYIQYFILGFLLADLYLSKINLRIPVFVSIVMGLFCLMFVGYVDLRQFGIYHYIFPIILFGFYLMVLTDGFWKKVFSMKFLTSVGGMCYSIYLLHYNIIPVIGNKTIHFNVSHQYLYAYLWHSLILIPTILFCSAIFYLLVEKPCMDKDWPKKLFLWVKSKIKSESLILPEKN